MSVWSCFLLTTIALISWSPATLAKMVGNVIESQFFKVPGGYDTAAALSFTLMAMILVLVFFYVRRFGTEELV